VITPYGLADALNPINAINQDIQKHAEYLRSIGKTESEIKGLLLIY
jgi:hypothetical protein